MLTILQGGQEQLAAGENRQLLGYSIGWLLCLAFPYGWHFSNKISLDWPLTLTTEPSTSKLSDNPDINTKASRKLYALRLLKRAGVQEQDMLKVFRESVRPILEYAVQVWQDIPDYLSDRIESAKKGT